MIRPGKSLTELTQEDLHALIGLPETLTLDFKRELKLDTGKGKLEFLKDVTSFANKIGGDIIYGVAEIAGVASSISGLQNENLDAVQQTMESLLRDSVQPRLLGYQIELIRLSGGSACLIIRVPRSWNMPHRVSREGHNRFYMRNSTGKHEASVEELREMFLAGTSLLQKVEDFRKDRLARLANGHSMEFFDPGGGLLLLHLVPLSAMVSPVQIVDPRAVHELRHDNFVPVGAIAASARSNFEGFLTYRNTQPCEGYVQVFRSGIVEATRSRLLETESIFRRSIAEQILKSVDEYLSGQAKLGISPPIAIMMTLAGMLGVRISCSDPFEGGRAFDNDEMCFAPALLDHFPAKAELEAAMKPAFDQLWQAASLPLCDLFSADGTFVGIGARG